MAVIKKTRVTNDVEKFKLSFPVDDYTAGSEAMENAVYAPYDLEILLVRIFPKESKSESF